MTTRAVNLDTTQYVKVNQGLNSLLLQAHRDSVRVVMSAVQPALSNTVFHVIGDDDELLRFPVLDADVWALAMTRTSSLVVTETIADVPQTSAYGELTTVENTPVMQIAAQYGLLDDVIPIPLGGTVTTQDSKFVVTSGTGANTSGTLVSVREAQYRAGQGLACRFTALFTDGVADNTQQAGFLTSEASFCFGYDGTSFGVMYSNAGRLEQQTLTITTGASGSELALITVDNLAFSVPITSGTPEFNAYEIATYLQSNRPGYSFTSNGATVVALARLADLGAGVWTFSSASAVATWVEMVTGVIPTEYWTPKAQWNVRPDIDIDPMLGNVYQIQVRYLGFGGINFFVEDPDTSEFVLVHAVRYSNTATTPIVSNPIFRVGWTTRNTGNTSDITVQGASAAAYTEGCVVYDGLSRGAVNTQDNIGTTRTNVLTIRNRLVFHDIACRAEVHPLLLSVATESARVTIFEVIHNPTVDAGEYLEFNFVDEDASLVEIATNSAPITGGDIVASFSVTLGGVAPIEMDHVLKHMTPGSTYAITARLATNGQSASVDASINWLEGL